MPRRGKKKHRKKGGGGSSSHDTAADQSEAKGDEGVTAAVAAGGGSKTTTTDEAAAAAAEAERRRVVEEQVAKAMAERAAQEAAVKAAEERAAAEARAKAEAELAHQLQQNEMEAMRAADAEAQAMRVAQQAKERAISEVAEQLTTGVLAAATKEVAAEQQVATRKMVTALEPVARFQQAHAFDQWRQRTERAKGLGLLASRLSEVSLRHDVRRTTAALAQWQAATVGGKMSRGGDKAAEGVDTSQVAVAERWGALVKGALYEQRAAVRKQVAAEHARKQAVVAKYAVLVSGAMQAQRVAVRDAVVTEHRQQQRAQFALQRLFMGYVAQRKEQAKAELHEVVAFEARRQLMMRAGEAKSVDELSDTTEARMRAGKEVLVTAAFKSWLLNPDNKDVLRQAILSVREAYKSRYYGADRAADIDPIVLAMGGSAGRGPLETLIELWRRGDWNAPASADWNLSSLAGVGSLLRRTVEHASFNVALMNELLGAFKESFVYQYTSNQLSNADGYDELVYQALYQEGGLLGGEQKLFVGSGARSPHGKLFTSLDLLKTSKADLALYNKAASTGGAAAEPLSREEIIVHMAQHFHDVMINPEYKSRVSSYLCFALGSYQPDRSRLPKKRAEAVHEHLELLSLGAEPILSVSAMVVGRWEVDGHTLGGGSASLNTLIVNKLLLGYCKLLEQELQSGATSIEVGVAASIMHAVRTGTINLHRDAEEIYLRSDIARLNNEAPALEVARAALHKRKQVAMAAAATAGTGVATAMRMGAGRR